MKVKGLVGRDTANTLVKKKLSLLLSMVLRSDNLSIFFNSMRRHAWADRRNYAVGIRIIKLNGSYYYIKHTKEKNTEPGENMKILS